MDIPDVTSVTTLRPRKVFHGWWMVASGFLLMMYTTGVGFFGFTSFVDPIADAIAGGSRAAIAGAVSIQRAESGILSPVLGFLVDKVNPRLILIVGFLIGGAGFILVGQVQTVLQFYLAYFLLSLGLGAGSFLIVSTAVSNWFVRLRGLALGFLFLGPSFAGFLVIGIVWSIEALGWRDTLVIIGIGMWIFCVPLALVMRRPPEEYGLLPDGDTPVSADDEETSPGEGVQPAEGSIPLRAVLRSRAYWQYVILLSIQQAGFSALVVFQIPALKTFGLSTTTAGVVVFAWAVGGIPGRLGAGYLSDIMDKRLVLSGAFILQLVGIVLFLTTTSFTQALFYGVIHGAGWGATTPARLSLQGEYWGRSIFGRLMGLQMGASAVGGIASPVIVGLMFDRTGDYHLPLAIFLLPLVVTIVLTLTLKRPQSTRESEPVAA